MTVIYIMMNDEIGLITKCQHIIIPEEEGVAAAAGEGIDCGIDHGGKCEMPPISKSR